MGKIAITIGAQTVESTVPDAKLSEWMRVIYRLIQPLDPETGEPVAQTNREKMQHVLDAWVVPTLRQHVLGARRNEKRQELESQIEAVESEV